MLRLSLLPWRRHVVKRFPENALSGKVHQQYHEHPGGKADNEYQALPPPLQNNFALADIFRRERAGFISA